MGVMSEYALMRKANLLLSTDPYLKQGRHSAPVTRKRYLWICTYRCGVKNHANHSLIRTGSLDCTQRFLANNQIHRH